jgi:hypothetical protein
MLVLLSIASLLSSGVVAWVGTHQIRRTATLETSCGILLLGGLLLLGASLTG